VQFRDGVNAEGQPFVQSVHETHIVRCPAVWPPNSCTDDDNTATAAAGSIPVAAIEALFPLSPQDASMAAFAKFEAHISGKMASVDEPESYTPALLFPSEAQIDELRRRAAGHCSAAAHCSAVQPPALPEEAWQGFT
jgi:hypothetical protein